MVTMRGGGELLLLSGICHFFRHAYGYTLDWAKLRPLVTDMPATLADMQGQLIAFFEGLHRAQRTLPMLTWSVVLQR